MNEIEYSHARNLHTLGGPRLALPLVLKHTPAKSLLDVGCGRGTWLNAALGLGITDVLGVEGINIKPEELLISPALFQVRDLRRRLELNRKFDLALCLEVAEHLEESFALLLIQSLTAHADTVVFSAACPDQEGQHHVNCQWPAYWQKLFNDQGFVCSDELRSSLWSEERIEPWYRQNMFIARRDHAGLAGKEPRLKSLVHPDMIELIVNTRILRHTGVVHDGGMPFKWYLTLPFGVLSGRLRRMLGAGKKADSPFDGRVPPVSQA